MKKMKLTLLSFGLLGGVLFAQENKLGSKEQVAEEHPIEMRNDHFGEGLDLTVDQAKRVEQIQKMATQQRQDLLYDESLDEESAEMELNRLNQMENQSLWEVLTPEQVRKYKELEKNLPSVNAQEQP
ncbi:MAG TPA: hypothetical protein VLY84_03615 [Dysgonamonadaceae bacterium]|nr:hypothetical protein [Dysgonamonadaceae bacterium]